MILETIRFVWSRLTIFDRLVVYTIAFLVVTIASLRIAGYE